jgi:hypothetical protein
MTMTIHRQRKMAVGGGLLFLLIILSVIPMKERSRSAPQASVEMENPRGLPPAENATYIPQLGGLRNETMHNQYGQKKELAECVVLRGSSVKDGKVLAPAGGLFYASSTTGDARPLMRDPFLILGEEAYLLGLQTSLETKTDVTVGRGEKTLIDPSGYRIWYENSTDHYGKPYGEFPLLQPSGGWQIELPVSTSFPKPAQVKDLRVESGINPQLKQFFMADESLYGLTRMQLKGIEGDTAAFSKIQYPTIKEAVFSLDRPYVVEVRQESYRWHRNKRIYAFRKENGIQVEVRNWTGKKVLASKLLVPSTQQQYKVEDQDKIGLTDFDLDIHIELVVDPSWNKGSDYAPWVNDVPYGWKDGTISFAVFHDLVKLKDGEPWKRDNRYLIRLEPNLMTGMLKRVILENKDSFELSKENESYAGPIKISEIWDRNYFNLVVRGIEKRVNDGIETEVVANCYLRDSFFRRTDNLILQKEGRENIDFFVGMSELVVSVMEDTFLDRLSDTSYRIPVVKSKFTSFPPVVPNAKWYAPDPTCAFVPYSEMKGLDRKYFKDRSGHKQVASEAIVIRASYVDYRKKQIVIPPGGLYYTSRNSRNIRPLSGESFFIAGKRAYLLSTQSYLVVRKNFRIDLWKEQPMGDGNLFFWQDVPLGDGGKALRYMESSLLWGRPVAVLRVVKYSGNPWGSSIIVAPGFNGYAGAAGQAGQSETSSSLSDVDKYSLPEMFAEGATYLIPRFVAPDHIEVAEMGSPGMDSFVFSYEKPQKLEMKVGEETTLGAYRLKVDSIQAAAKTAKLSLKDEKGRVLLEKTLGPVNQELLDTLPQYNQSQQKVMLQYQDVHVELDLSAEFSGNTIALYATTGATKIERDKPWPDDPQFVVRPEVCGHCYMLNELILDNAKPIILDEKNNVIWGPNKYFKIVVDDFDGEKINAWHIEDSIGTKTPNLAEYPRNNLDVMAGMNGTIETFLRKTLLNRLAYREVWRLK